MAKMTDDELMRLLQAIEDANRIKQQEEMEEARAWNQG